MILFGPEENVRLGTDSSIAPTAYLDVTMAQVVIGDRTHILDDVKIWTHTHDWHALDWTTKPETASSLVISDDVIVGANAVILPQVEFIGQGAIIGAFAVVGKNVPAWAVMVGNPAREIGKRRCEHP